MTEFLIKQFIKNDNIQDLKVREKYGFLGAIVGIIVNFILFAIKLITGILINSISVTADAFNNLSDTASSLITMIGFKLGNRPADEGHPFGHGRIEYFSGLIVSLLVLYVGIQFMVSSFERIINPTPLDFQWVPVILLILSIFSKVWISGFNTKIGTKINSSALKASGLDARGDVMISSTVVGGLLFSRFTGYQIDGYVGIFVAGMIIKSAYDLIRETLNPLLGTQQDGEIIEKMEDILMGSDEIFGVHDTIAHNYGPNTIIATTHVEVREDIQLITIHDIVDALELQVRNELGIDLVIHIDPIRLADEGRVEVIRHLRKELMAVAGIKSVHDIRLRDDGNRFIAELVLNPDTDAKALLEHAEEIVRDHGLVPQLSAEIDKILVGSIR